MKYYPSRWSWERKTPKELGLDPEEINKAVEWTKSHETEFPVNLAHHIRGNNNNKTWDDGEVLGPTNPGQVQTVSSSRTATSSPSGATRKELI